MGRFFIIKYLDLATCFLFQNQVLMKVPSDKDSAKCMSENSSLTSTTKHLHQSAFEPPEGPL